MIPRDPAEAMVVERDVPITMDDGLVIRADVYRPKTQEPVPVIMTSGPYGKGVRYQEHYKLMWDCWSNSILIFFPARHEVS
jgi:predicted acyl esterase